MTDLATRRRRHALPSGQLVRRDELDAKQLPPNIEAAHVDQPQLIGETTQSIN
jgi:hypothetical protein